VKQMPDHKAGSVPDFYVIENHKLYICRSGDILETMTGMSGRMGSRFWDCDRFVMMWLADGYGLDSGLGEQSREPGMFG